MMDNNALEKLVGDIARDQRAPAVVLIIINQEGSAEVLSVMADGAMESCGNPRLDLAGLLERVADEVKDGGGIPCGNDGTTLPY